jgi:BASS family bile acid:Na+ symporter
MSDPIFLTVHMSKRPSFLLKLIESYVFVLCVALGAGLFLSKYAIFLAPYSTLFLCVIFFLSSLKINLKEIGKDIKDVPMLIMVNAWMLIILPIVTYMATRVVAPEFAVAFMLLAAMPVGMTSPLLAEVIGGRESLALVFTVTTSLLAPFTVPLMVKLMAGTSVTVGFWTMFISLAKVIFIPFAAAQLVHWLWPKQVAAFAPKSKPVSIVLLGLLIAGIVAGQAATILSGLNGPFIMAIVWLFVLFALFHVLGYFTVFWRSVSDRMTITLCVTYLNFTLAIYLAGLFFKDPNVVVPVVLSVLPWSLYMIPFKYFAARAKDRRGKHQ